MSLRTILYALLAIGLWTTQGMAAATQAYKSSSVEARLITAENGVAPGASALSAGLSLKLSEGWKTYWRSPGEVGLPPEIDWSGSTNLASAKILWPAPTRFRAFGIENFGYAKQVTFPFQITLADPGKPAILKADVFLLICSDVCVPQDFSLTLDLPAATGVDQSSADEIAAWSAKVPLDSAATLLNASASLSEDGSALMPSMAAPIGQRRIFSLKRAMAPRLARPISAKPPTTACCGPVFRYLATYRVIRHSR